MFTVLDPLLEFTYHLLFSWRKFALCIQSLLCMLFLFGWPPCQRSNMILMEVSQHAYDMIHYISGLFGYFYVCEIYVNLIWYLYLFMLNNFCLSLSLSLSHKGPVTRKMFPFHDVIVQCQSTTVVIDKQQINTSIRLLTNGCWDKWTPFCRRCLNAFYSIQIFDFQITFHWNRILRV